MGAGSQSVEDGITSVRLRGFFEAILTTVTGANDGYVGAIGVCIVSENAFGVGITAVPVPITDMAWDGWLYHRFFSLHGAGAVGDGAGVFTRFEVDSKAMRKFKSTDIMVAVMEVTEDGTAVMDSWFDSRVLVKLP